MGLRLKFNLVLVVVFLAGFAAAGYISRQLLQENARDMRYRFFEEVARAEGAGLVAVGSTMDDQAETVLLHLFRGSGPRGTAGMPADRPISRGSDVRLVRPLLTWSRADVEALAADFWTIRK